MNQSLPIIIEQQEQATDAGSEKQERPINNNSKSTKISKATLASIALVTIAGIVTPAAILAKLYRDEKYKNKTLPCPTVATNEPFDNKDASPHAMTTWWVIFNNPGNCTQAPDQEIKCGAVDVFGSAFLDTQEAGTPDLGTIQVNTAAGIGMLYATGGVTDDDGDIRMQASIFKSTDILSLPYAMDPMELGVTLFNPNAEVHLIIRDHGVSVGDVTQTLADVDDYCDDPPFLWSGPKQHTTGNVCSDFQAVAFAAGEAGMKKLTFVETGTESEESAAQLFRRGDGLQAIIVSNVFEVVGNE